MNPNNWMTDDYSLSKAIEYTKDGKIAAIKSLRYIVQKESMLGLKEAKDIVENIMNQERQDVEVYRKEFERLTDDNIRLTAENKALRSMLVKTLKNTTHEQLVNVVLGML